MDAARGPGHQAEGEFTIKALGLTETSLQRPGGPVIRSPIFPTELSAQINPNLEGQGLLRQTSTHWPSMHGRTFSLR